MKSQLHDIEQREKEIIAAEKQISFAEKRIEKEEKEILQEEKVVVAVLRQQPLTYFKDTFSRLREMYYLRLLMVRKIARHKLLFTIIVTVGIVLIWRGIWDIADHTPIVSYGIVSVLIGVSLLWLLKKYTDLF